MTPRKCARHELRPGEMGDSPRYLRALVEARTCWRCRLWGVAAVAQYLWDYYVRGMWH